MRHRRYKSRRTTCSNDARNSTLITTFTNNMNGQCRSRSNKNAHRRSKTRALRKNILSNSRLIFAHFLLLVNRLRGRSAILYCRAGRRSSTGLTRCVRHSISRVRRCRHTNGNRERHRRSGRQIFRTLRLNNRGRMGRRSNGSRNRRRAKKTFTVLLKISNRYNARNLIRYLLNGLIRFIRSLPSNLPINGPHKSNNKGRAIMAMRFQEYSTTNGLG